MPTLGLAAAVLAGCGAARPTAVPPPPTVPSTATTVAPRTLAATPAAATPRPTSTALPAFHDASARVTAAQLPHTWRAGCPTPPAQLRMLTLAYVDFAGHAQTGHLVIAAAYVRPVVAIFADLYAHRFPIRRIVPVDAYGGSDDASVAADNTAGFNCRRAVAPGPPSWSMHAYGAAIDVDPVENPYLEAGRVDPPAGAAFLDRADRRPGMALPGGELVEAFARQGWKWGVTFGDYQHFSVNGQ